MKPKAGKRLAGKRFRLRDFIFVMWENEILASSVKIETLAQFFHRHHGTLQMPPRPAGANHRAPGSLAGFGGFPQCEIAGAVLIIFVHIYARAILHSSEIFLRELAILREFGDAEVVRAVFGAVSNVFFHQPSYKLRHLLNMLGGAHQRWFFDADQRAIFEKCLLELRGVFVDAHAVAGRVADDLVVHVGDVHDMVDAVPALPQETAQQIDGNKRPEVANVSIVVNGWTAGVHSDFVVAQRMEVLDLRGHGVVKTKRHSWTLDDGL